MSDTNTAAVETRTFDPAKYEPSIIAKATEQGWVAPDKYSGKGTWLPPDEFIERGERVTPIIRSRLANAEKELADLRRDNQQLVEDGRVFKKMVEAGAQREWQEKYNELQARLAQAVQDGAGPEAATATVALTEHAATKPKDSGATGTKGTPAPDQEVQRPAWMTQWAAQNTWYDTNPDARFMANSIGVILAKTGLEGEALAEAVKAEMTLKFPKMVGVQEDDTRGSTVATPGRRQPPSGATVKSYENMPADAQKACDRMVARKWGTREDYVTNYFAQEGQ